MFGNTVTVALRCTEAWSRAALDNRLNDLKDTVDNVAEILKLAQCVVVFEFHGSSSSILSPAVNAARCNSLSGRLKTRHSAKTH